VTLARSVRLALISVTLLMAGCAGKLHHQLVALETGAYVFHLPSAEVLQHAERLLLERGYDILQDRDGPLEVRTAWKTRFSAEGMASSAERYIVHVKPLTPSHCRAEVVRVSRSTLGLEEFHPTLGGGGPIGREGGGKNVNTMTYGNGSRPLPMGPPILARDPTLEMELISRLEPVRAKQISERVNAYERRVKASPRD
jgi:hypothetical protein